MPKNGRWASETEFIVEIEAMCEYVEGDNAHAIAHEGVYTFDMVAMTAARLDDSRLQSSPTATQTAVYHTKSSFIQWGYYGGDGIDLTDLYYGRMTPQLIIYADGQMLINEGGRGTTTFLESTLTTSEMCALLNQIETTGFLKPHDEADYYTQRDGNEGASNLVVQVEDILYDFYHPDTPYLVPNLASGLEVIRTVSADYPTDMTYIPETLIIWIDEVDEAWLSWARYEEEKTIDGEWLSRPGSEEKVNIFPWPTDFPPLSDLWTDPTQNQITITDDNAPVIYNWFDNALSERFVRFEDSLYFMIARLLLPHETPTHFSDFPRWPQNGVSPINCNNLE